jgi:hypothetical protein
MTRPKARRGGGQSVVLGKTIVDPSTLVAFSFRDEKPVAQLARAGRH